MQPVDPFQTIPCEPCPWWLQVPRFVILLVLAPVRACLLLALSLILWLACFVLLLGAKVPRQPGEPEFSRTRAWLVCHVIQPLLRLMLLVSAIHVRCRHVTKDETRCTTRPTIPHGIIVANHIGYIDAMAIVAYFGCSVVAKDEIHHYPMFGILGDSLQAIWIKRRDPEDRRRAQSMIVERGHRKDCRSLILFPEGTTTNGRSVIQFSKGAFESGLPVHPVAVRCNFRYFDPSYQNQPLLMHALHLFLGNIYHTIDLDVLNVYEPNASEQDDASLYAKNVQIRIATHLGVPASDIRGKDNPALQQPAAAATSTVETVAFDQV